MKFYLPLFHILCFVSLSLQTLTISNPTNLQIKIDSPLYRRSGQKSFNISGEMIISEPYDGCSPSNSEGIHFLFESHVIIFQNSMEKLSWFQKDFAVTKKRC